MSALTPCQRAAILSEVKQLSNQIQDPNLTMTQIDQLQKRRAELSLRLVKEARRAMTVLAPGPTEQAPQPNQG